MFGFTWFELYITSVLLAWVSAVIYNKRGKAEGHGMDKDASRSLLIGILLPAINLIITLILCFELLSNLDLRWLFLDFGGDKKRGDE